MNGQVLSNGNEAETFAISNVVKQGCFLVPFVFNILFICMLLYAVQDLEKGVCVRYGSRTVPFLPASPDCQGKDPANPPPRYFFADNCTLVAHTDSDPLLMLN
ncbi:hypothetical protein ElyMa_002256500 [Elysia marginata]|uniref:Uncharacterized protein n=1 Tax=Elysia marginata TaxID=1093978 RepID=A0AAV4FXT1_9GAST|nr:hypothetical protein ElyMa_002256500 [Elysia marginata]